MTGRSFQSYLNALMNPGDTRREVCAIPGCRRASAARGLCATHYKRTLAGKDKVEIGLALGAGPSDTVEASIASGYGPAWSEVSERDKERIITRVQEAIEKKQGTLEGFNPLLFATRCGVNASISAHRAAQSAPRILARQVAKEEVRSEEQRRVMALRKRFPQLSEEFVNLARKDTAEKPVKAVSFRSVWRELFCGIRNADELSDTVLKRRVRMRENLQGRASNDLLGLLGWTVVDPDFRHLEDLRAKNDPERLPAEVQRLPDPPKVKPPRRELPERGFAVSLPKAGGRGRRPVDLTPWKHLFGQYSDSELALITGVAYATVRKYREMWGIPRTPGYLRKNPSKERLIAAIAVGSMAGKDLSNADLSDAKLFRASLSRSKLSGANLTNATLWGAKLYKSNLSGADLSGADLSTADLREADLSGANLSGADLGGAILTGANLTGATMPDGTRDVGHTSRPTAWAGMYPAGRGLLNMLFSPRLNPRKNPSQYWKDNIQKAVKAHKNRLNYALGDIYAEHDDRDMSGLDLSDTNLGYTNLRHVDLSRADLSFADLRGADLYGANLTGANLTGANLTRAFVHSVNLTGADLSGANLSGAELGGAILTGAMMPDGTIHP